MLTIRIKALAGLTAICCAFCFLLIAGPGQALAGKWKERSQQHEADCNKWCAEHKDVCSHCSTLSGCGKDYESIMSWTGYGKNWHACKKRGRLEASEQNKADCEKWCGENKDKGCVKCSKKLGCGKHYDQLKSWTGRGDNWYACKPRLNRDQASAKLKTACQKWCDEHKDKGCVKCSEKVACGQGYDKMKSFTGRGHNWYACKKRAARSQESQENLTACVTWCEGHKDKGCSMCSRRPGCGPGFFMMKNFAGRGDNWYACKSRELAGQQHKEACEKFCEQDKRLAEEFSWRGPVCRYCSTKSTCGSDKVLARYMGMGKNWYACGR